MSNTVVQNTTTVYDYENTQLSNIEEMTFRGIVDNVPITWETSFFLALLLRSQTQRARLVLLLDTQTIAKANNTGAKIVKF